MPEQAPLVVSLSGHLLSDLFGSSKMRAPVIRRLRVALYERLIEENHA
jgi:hypothetical protein